MAEERIEVRSGTGTGRVPIMRLWPRLASLSTAKMMQKGLLIELTAG